MKYSFHSLIPFLPLFYNCQFRRLDLIQFLRSQAHILAGWRPETRPWSILLNNYLLPLCTDHAENSIYYEEVMFTDPLSSDRRPVVAALAPAGMCLPSRCLAMVLYATIYSYTYNGYFLEV
jgi:hypothetical protein